MTTLTAAAPHLRTATHSVSDPRDAVVVVVELTDIVARATRYPPDILEPHADFEHDLGIDSVKLGEILVLVREHYRIDDAQRIDQDRFRTIATLAQAIVELFATVPQTLAQPAAAPPPAAAPARTGDVITELTALIAEATRYPVEILEPQADFEHDLGIDSVKLGEILVLVRRHFALADDVAIAADAFGNIELAAAAIEIVLGVPSFEPAGIPVGQSPAPVEAQVGHSSAALIATITRVVARTTRYPVDILQPDADFEHDLGIDSVKLGEILVVLRTELGLNETHPIAVDRFRTIADTAAALSELFATASDTPRIFSADAIPAVSSEAPPARRPVADSVALVSRHGGKPLLGKTVLVTGSGHGIGKDIAQTLATLGATVVVNAFHSREAGESTAREIVAAGGDAHFIWASVANARQRTAMFEEIESRCGGLDFLICNASNGLIGPFDDIREDDWEKGFRTNVVGLHQMSLLAAQLMSKRGGGKIVTLSSTASYRHINGFGCMAALKSAVESLTRTMAVEFERHNVAVTCLSPGPVEGDLITKFPDGRSADQTLERFVHRQASRDELRDRKLRGPAAAGHHTVPQRQRHRLRSRVELCALTTRAPRNLSRLRRRRKPPAVASRTTSRNQSTGPSSNPSPCVFHVACCGSMSFCSPCKDWRICLSQPLTALIAGAGYPNAAVAIDARAVYGGMPLGLATLLALLARGGRDFQSVGQLGCVVLFGGVATGRLAGMIVTQSFSPLMLSVFVSEIVFAGLCGYAFALLRVRQRPNQTPEKT